MLDVKLVSKVVKCFILCLDIIEFIPLRYTIKTLKFSFMHTEQHRATYRYFIYANCMTNQINLAHQPDLSTRQSLLPLKRLFLYEYIIVIYM